MKKIKRPWQGWVLTVMGILLLLFTTISTVVGLNVFLKAAILTQSSKIAADFFGIFMVSIISSHFLIVFGMLMILGYFCGKRIAVFGGLFITGLMFVFNLFSIKFEGMMFLSSLLGLVVVALVGWLHISVLKHPFYGGDGKLSLDTFKFWKKRTRKGEMTTF